MWWQMEGISWLEENGCDPQFVNYGKLENKDWTLEWILDLTLDWTSFVNLIIRVIEFAKYICKVKR